jgi:hypothetical protein
LVVLKVTDERAGSGAGSESESGAFSQR